MHEMTRAEKEGAHARALEAARALEEQVSGCLRMKRSLRPGAGMGPVGLLRHARTQVAAERQLPHCLAACFVLDSS